MGGSKRFSVLYFPYSTPNHFDPPTQSTICGTIVSNHIVMSSCSQYIVFTEHDYSVACDAISVVLACTSVASAKWPHPCYHHQPMQIVKQQRAEISDRSQSISAVHISRQTNNTTPAGHSQCPACNATCYHCQKVGHLAKVCCSKSLCKAMPQLSVESFQQPPMSPAVTTLQGINTIRCRTTATAIIATHPACHNQQGCTNYYCLCKHLGTGPVMFRSYQILGLTY